MFLRVTRLLGALAVLAVGAIHLQQYAGSGYQAIPTIGPLFLLNGIGCGIVGLALLLPIERWLSHRSADAALALLAAGGIAIALGSLVALFISETARLFGFSESGYRTPVVVAIVAEVAAIVLLVPLARAKLTRTLFPRRRARPEGGAGTRRPNRSDRWSGGRAIGS